MSGTGALKDNRATSMFCMRQSCKSLPQIEELIHPQLLRTNLLAGAGGEGVPTQEPLLASPILKSTPDERVQVIERELAALTVVPKAMQSITNLYRVGRGPSSSHTMGPSRAALRFKSRLPEGTVRVRCHLYGSLALTGKGHLTDTAVIEALDPMPVEVVWRKSETLPRHPNAMKFEALDSRDKVLTDYVVYSVGGGAIVDDSTAGGAPNTPAASVYEVYQEHTMTEVLGWCKKTGKPLWQYVFEMEGEEKCKTFLAEMWRAMSESIDRGLNACGMLPGGLKLKRNANTMFLRAKRMLPVWSRNLLIFSYALAVSEENASAGVVVTAPTCGACGVVPAVLRWTKEMMGSTEEEVIRALAVAGLIGNIAKTNASISGAEVGCQGEVGVACAMAAAACTQLIGGSPVQIERAAEMALEHHLGLNCCPVEGLVQVPCIERNAHGAVRSIDCAQFAMSSDEAYILSYDETVLAMKLSGLDMKSEYKETSLGGISLTYDLDEKLAEIGKANVVKQLESQVKQLREQLEAAKTTKQT